MDCDLIDKLFYFFNRQSLLLAGKQDIKLYSILAGIILFAPDRGLSKLSYRKSKIGSDSGQKVSLGSNCIGIQFKTGIPGLIDISDHNYIDLIQSIQDECFDLLQGYVERYRSFEKSLLREVRI